MRLTQYLIFEVCKGCNLGKAHDRCPNMSPQRWEHVQTNRPMTDATIVATAAAMYHEHGFRGRIGWHYYNEPLMAEKRLWRLMDAIDAEVPEAEYTLWTNGTKWPKEPENLERFAELHLTDYRLPKFPVDTRAWRKANRKTQVHHWQLDERLRVLGVTDTRPCRRMYTEFICDFYGNVHLCCYDWRGLASPGNVQTDPLPELIAKWQAVRTRIGGVTMDEESPEACLRCDLRSDYIPDFVPEIARDARCQ